jgi:hypothetical protein
VPYVRVGDPVLSRWLADPHLDNIACLGLLASLARLVAQSADRYETSILAALNTARFAQRTVLSIDNCRRYGCPPRAIRFLPCRRSAVELPGLGIAAPWQYGYLIWQYSFILLARCPSLTDLTSHGRDRPARLAVRV